MTARLQREAEDNMSEMDRAKELLKMKTVKIQQAAAPEVPFLRPDLLFSELRHNNGDRKNALVI